MHSDILIQSKNNLIFELKNRHPVSPVGGGIRQGGSMPKRKKSFKQYSPDTSTPLPFSC